MLGILGLGAKCFIINKYVIDKTYIILDYFVMRHSNFKSLIT